MGKQLISALERLKQQRAKIDARIQKTESRYKTNERKQDARRKILIGAYYMDKAQKEGKYHELVKRIDSFLTRNSDRRLFGLPELVEENNKTATKGDDKTNLSGSGLEEVSALPPQPSV